MKHHLNHKRHLIRSGHDFYSERHNGDNYYSLMPRRDGFFDLFKNDLQQPFVVCCRHDRLIAIGIGSRKGHSDVIHYSDAQMLDFNFIDESNFVEENENFTASFNGEEVLLHSGESRKPDSFYFEHSLV